MESEEASCLLSLAVGHGGLRVGAQAAGQAPELNVESPL